VIVATVGAASLSLIVPVAEAVPDNSKGLIGFCNSISSCSTETVPVVVHPQVQLLFMKW
jgi:hypothetical protein